MVLSLYCCRNVFNGLNAGFSYGLTSVIVGQPLDTIKTTTQMGDCTQKKNFMRIGYEMMKKDGILKGLYRGSAAMVAGGALIRSAQFGVNSTTLSTYIALINIINPNQVPESR